MKRMWIPVLAIAFAAPAAAQAPAQQGPMSGANWIWGTVKGYVTRSAEQLPDSLYAFRPTPEVRTFGQLIGHMINSHYSYCSTALGEENPSPGNAEEITAKAELVAALRASVEYCDRAYALPDARALELTRLYGGERTRLAVLEFNATHDMEHYGNIVTYMRIKGMVPPSSQRGGDDSSDDDAAMQSDSAAVVRAVDGFHAALAGGDTAAAMALLHADTRIIEGGNIETREEYRGGHLGADMAYASAVPRQKTSQQVRVSGNAAWVVTRSLTTGEYRGRAVNSEGAELMVLLREGADWKITAIHWSSRTRRSGS